MPSTKYTDGSVWGNKQIVRYHSHNKYKQPTYVWRCIKCQEEYGPSTGTDIARSPYTKCCPRRYEEKINYKGYRLVTGSKMTQIKDSVRKRGLECSVNAEYLWNLFESQDGKCAYTGLPIELNKNASLDRIDSSTGYIPGNVHWVLWDINRMKWNIPHQDFIQLCWLVASRNGEINGTDKDKQDVDTPRSF